MATRPSTARKWAEQADAKDLENPGPERDTGYLKGQALPNDQLNKLLQDLFDWVDYFDELFQRSDGLIDFFSGIYFGKKGDFNKAIDDTTDYFLELVHTEGGASTLAADHIRAFTDLAGDILKPLNGATVLLHDAAGAFGYLVAKGIDAGPETYLDVREGTTGDSGSGGLFVSFLRLYGGALNLRDEQGNANAGSIFGAVAQFDQVNTDKVRGNADDEVVFRNAGDTGPGSARAKSTAKAWAKVDVDTSGPSASLGVGFAASSASRVKEGQYRVTFDEGHPIPDVCTVVSSQGTGGTKPHLHFVVDPSGGNGGQVDVYTYDDTNTLTEHPYGFYLVLFALE